MMRFACTAALFLSMAALGQDKPSDAAKFDFKAHMQKVIDTWAALDWENIPKFYAPEAGRVFFDVAPVKYNGIKNYVEGFKKVSGDFSSMKFTLNNDHRAHTRGPNFAWATTTMHGVIVPKEGPKTEGEFRWTALFEKKGDDWLIVHEHVSAPLPDGPPPPAPSKPAGKKK